MEYDGIGEKSTLIGYSLGHLFNRLISASDQPQRARRKSGYRRVSRSTADRRHGAITGLLRTIAEMNLLHEAGL
jgi:hypothetical protein